MFRLRNLCTEIFWMNRNPQLVKDIVLQVGTWMKIISIPLILMPLLMETLPYMLVGKKLNKEKPPVIRGFLYIVCCYLLLKKRRDMDES